MTTTHPTIVTALERHALNDPHKPAFIFINESLERLVLTRQHVWDYCRKFAAVLRKTGLKKGDVICNTLPNSPQLLLSMLGTITAGCITMGAQTCMTDGSDLVSSLNRGAARGIIVDSSDTKGTFPVLKPRLQDYDPISGNASCRDVPSLEFVISYTLGDAGSFLESLDEEEEMYCVDTDPNDACAYMSTSGSSGRVKMMPVSSNVMLELAEEALGNKRGKVFMSDFDMGWIGGFPHVYLALGSTRVLLDRGGAIPEKSVELQWKIAVKEHCQVCLTNPQYMMEFPIVRKNNVDDKIRNYKLETLLIGGGPVTRKHMQAALGEIADEVRIAYASTEAGLTSCYQVHSLNEFEDFNNGKIAANTKIKIVDNNNKEVPRGDVGEIVIKTKQSLLHYMNDPDNTATTFGPDGWIRLGDKGKVNDKGHLYVVGRDKFAISKGTIVFYPEVIESFVRKCPGIKDVAIVGVPDEKMVEEICALVIQHPSAEISEKHVRNFCESNVIQDHLMVPKYIMFVESFPRTHRGKLNRNEAKKLACDWLGL